MPTQLRRTAAAGALLLTGAFGSVMAVAWSPTSLALVQAAAAGDDDDDNGDDDDAGQVPAGGVATGAGGIAGDDDDDNGDDDDAGQVPAGGVATGAGGAADLVSTSDAGSRDGGSDAAIPTVAALAAGGFGAFAAGGLALTRLAGRHN